MSAAPAYRDVFVEPLLADAVLGACRHESLARLLPHLSLHRFDTGESLWSRQQAADAVWLLLSGQVVLATDAGDVRVESGLCGEEGALGWPQHDGGAVAGSAVSALRIPRESMEKLCKHDPALRERLQALRRSRRAGRAPTATATTAAAATRPASRREWLGWSCAIVSPLVVLATCRNIGLMPDAVVFLAILAATVSMWVFNLADEFVPGLFAVMATLALGLTTPERALAGFASEGFFLALAVLGIGAVISASGLSFRFLLWLIDHLPDGPRWREAGMLLTGFLLTPLVPSINGRVALTTPLLQDMVDVLRVRPGDTAATRLAIATFGGVSLLSAVFLTSKSVNFVVYGLLDPQTQAEFHWLHWTLAAGVLGIALLLAHGLIAMVWPRPQAGAGDLAATPGGAMRIDDTRAQIKAQLSLLGALRNREWAALAGVMVFVVGVASTSWHRIQPSWIALGVLLALLVFGMLRKEEFRERIDWPFLMYLGGLVGLTGTLNAVGLDRWLGEHLAWLGHFMRDSFPLFIALLTLVLSLIRLVVPISATVVIAATVFMPIASAHGVNPWVVGFCVLVLGEMWFLPYQCSYYLQFRELGRRSGYSEPALLRFNAVLNVCRVGALYLSLPWWRQMGLL